MSVLFRKKICIQDTYSNKLSSNPITMVHKRKILNKYELMIEKSPLIAPAVHNLTAYSAFSLKMEDQQGQLLNNLESI